MFGGVSKMGSKTSELEYIKFLEHILAKGIIKSDRTGTGTKSVFGYQMRFDLSEGFPLLTSKKVAFKSIVAELIWFIRGDSNIRYLVENKVRIWDEWAFERYIKSEDYTGEDMTNFGIRKEQDAEFKVRYELEMENFRHLILTDDAFCEKWGDLGRIYGKQWRQWITKDGGTIDQIREVIEQIKTNPDSRRHIVTAWNPSEVKYMALPPCHAFFQLYVAEGKVSCQLYQRSGDAFLGVPFNIASYALLTHLIALECGLEVGEFIHTFGDAHIYLNHFEQVELQLSRKDDLFDLPEIQINPDKSIFDLEIEDIVLLGYQSHAKITAPVAV